MTKPCIGYPSKTAAVVALRAEKRALSEIAATLGVSEQTVRSMANLRVTVVVDEDARPVLTQHAQRRGMSVNVLIRTIVQLIADEPHLVDAILDDGECHARRD